MSLIQTKPPATEPVSLIATKAFLRIEHSAEDDLLHHLIKSARLSVEAYLTRSLIQQEWCYSFNVGHAAAHTDPRYLQGLHSRGDQGIELPRSPFIKLTAPIKRTDAFGEREIKTYRLDTSGRIGKLYFDTALSTFLEGRGTIKITFTAGYGKKPEDIPETLSHAILMLVADFYENRTGDNDNQFIAPPMPSKVLQMIKPYRVLRLA